MFSIYKCLNSCYIRIYKTIFNLMNGLRIINYIIYSNKQFNYTYSVYPLKTKSSFQMLGTYKNHQHYLKFCRKITIALRNARIFIINFDTIFILFLIQKKIQIQICRVIAVFIMLIFHTNKHSYPEQLLVFVVHTNIYPRWESNLRSATPKLLVQQLRQTVFS